MATVYNGLEVLPRKFFRVRRDVDSFWYLGGGAEPTEIVEALKDPECCYPGFPDPTVFMYIMASVLLWLVVYFVSYVGSNFISKTYRSLGRVDRIEWCSRVVSSIHASISAAVGLYLWWTIAEYEINLAFAQPDAVVYLACFSVGYIMFDTLLLALNRNEESVFVWQIFIHHIVSILAVFLNFVFGVGSVCGIFLLTTEFSTPFVNQRWFLLKCGLRESYLYTINGILMAAAFFGCRVVWPFSGAIYYNMYHRHLIRKLPVLLELLLWFLFAFYVILNAYWASLIYHGLVRVLRGKSEEKQKRH